MFTRTKPKNEVKPENVPSQSYELSAKPTDAHRVVTDQNKPKGEGRPERQPRKPKTGGKSQEEYEREYLEDRAKHPDEYDD